VPERLCALTPNSIRAKAMVKNVFIFTVFKVDKIQKTGQKPGKKYKYEKTNFKKGQE
jgi:hypothetical protein